MPAPRRRIELFGSATGAGFEASHSDLDFLVTFQELEFNQYADAYFGLLEDLQALFERPVDWWLAPPFRTHASGSR
jgi:uncharacterized protein